MVRRLLLAVALLLAPAEASASESDTLVGSYVAIGLSGAGLMTALIAGTVAIDQNAELKSRCEQKRCPTGTRDTIEALEIAAAIATLGATVAVSGAGLGVTLFVMAQDDAGVVGFSARF
jgi:hypothetical protein